jgi:hypothetical protein
MTRSRLPNRRPSVNVGVIWQTDSGEAAFTLTAGFDPATGRLREVFYSDGLKSGTAMLHTIQDACVLVSLGLQHGAYLDHLAHSLGRLGKGCTEPASPIGAIVDALVAVGLDVDDGDPGPVLIEQDFTDEHEAAQAAAEAMLRDARGGDAPR